MSQVRGVINRQLVSAHSLPFQKISTMANNVFKILMGLSVLVASVAFLILVSCNGFAGDESKGLNQKDPLAQALADGEGGNYRMIYETGSSADGSWHWHVFVYNIHTGAYKAYYWDIQAQGWTENFSESAALPKLP